MDETLIHNVKNLSQKCDKIVKIHGSKTIGVNIRPKIHKNLLKLKKKFNLVVFTAGLKPYADPIIDMLDPDNSIFCDRFFRDSCTEFLYQGGSVFTKDLRIFEGLDLNNTLLVDNAAFSLGFQLDNGIPILPFYNDKLDDEFDRLAQYLLMLKGDLVEANKNAMNLRELYKRVNEEEYSVHEVVESEPSFNSEES